MKPPKDCPCGSSRAYAACCGPLHTGETVASSADTLMRSRYSAYVLKLDDYLLTTWHPASRPAELDLAADDTRWLGLDVRRHTVDDEQHATVEFVARYRIAGKGHRLHETSRFVRDNGRWVYLSGTFRS